MSRSLLKYFTLFIIYFGLILLIHSLEFRSVFVSALFLIMVILTFNFLEKKLNSIVYRYSLKFSKHLEKLLADFDQKLNRRYTYYKLLDDLYVFFKHICRQKAWAFYVFENDDFRLTKTSYNKKSASLPETILRTGFKSADFVHSLSDLNIAEFSGFDFVMVLPGKSGPFGLLFTKSSYFSFLQDKALNTQFKSVIRKAGQVLENTALYLDLLEKNRQIQQILAVSEIILSTLNTDKILQFLLDTLDDIISFDAGVIYLFDSETNDLKMKSSKGYNDDTNLNLKIGQGACGWVAENRTVSLLKDVSTADYYYPAREQTRSQVALPLQIHDELIGVLCLESNKIAHFNQKSQEVLNLLANHAAIALNNARQYEVSQKKQALEHELIHAGKIQQVLLPSHPPSYPKLNISFTHRPSEIISGDLFDLAPLNDHTLGVLVGDVSGKGAYAAIMMSLVLAGFRAFNKTYLAVCEVVARLNSLLEESTSVGYYTTLFYALIGLDQNKITYTNAGHNPPYLINSAGKITELSGGGIMIGFLADQIFTQHEIEFNTGDILVAYTDGITEAMNRDEKEFGEERFKDVLVRNRHLNSYDLKDIVFKEIQDFTNRKNQADDMTLVIVKYT